MWGGNKVRLLQKREVDLNAICRQSIKSTSFQQNVPFSRRNPPLPETLRAKPRPAQKSSGRTRPGTTTRGIASRFELASAERSESKSIYGLRPSVTPDPKTKIGLSKRQESIVERSPSPSAKPTSPPEQKTSGRRPSEYEAGKSTAAVREQARSPNVPGSSTAPASAAQPPAATPPYAVSRTASRIACVCDDQIVVQELGQGVSGGPQSWNLEPGRAVCDGTSVSALEFTDDDGLAIQYCDGTIEVWDRQYRRIDVAPLWDVHTEPRASDGSSFSLAISGKFVATASLPDARAVVVEIQGDAPELAHHHYRLGATDGMVLAISPSGRPAVGTRSAMVSLARSEGEESIPAVVLEAPGPVRALAFYEEQAAFIGGDFRGIHSVRPGRGPREVIAAPVGVRLLAIADNQLAYEAAGEIRLFTYAFFQSITGIGISIAAGWLLLTAGLVAAPTLVSRLRSTPLPSRGRESKQVPLVASTALPDPPQALIDAIGRGECILYAGGGLSAQAGLPTRVGLLQRLVELGRERGLIAEDEATALARALAAGHREDAADEIAELIPRDNLREAVRNTVESGRLTAVHRILAELPFAGVLTTNFDGLLSAGFSKRKPPVFAPSDTEPLLNSLREKTFFILHLQGRLDDSMLFTLKEYRDALAKNLAFRQFMQTLFVRNTLFFVGTHLQSIRDYLSELDLASVRPDREHFAIVGRSGELDEVQMRSLKRNFGVNVIAFRPRPNYPEVKEFLQKIREGVLTLERPAEGASRMVLERVVLKNIGPFEELDVPLNPSWNVILGDNGVGKSAVLRAIAAALCGEDAEEAAVTRLLRSGEKSGTIELHVGTARYTVELQRDAEGRVHIASGSLSPLKLSNWLVLGFPPLRTISWDRPKGPSPDPQKRPSPADLLPILAGKPDTRLNDIKQRLINLDYRASGGSAAAEGAARLFDKFFHVLDEVTPGMKLKFHSINKETYEILLDTDTGVVPIESISQGTVSVMGWVGLLLQRLYDIHGSLENPETAGALVLVDEIDAHMHPAWQRSVVPALRRLFPNVQVIASTHSPLIVGDMNANEVLLAQRDETGRSTLEHPKCDVQGMRADQILTGPLFGLTSTRSHGIEQDIATYSALLGKTEKSDEEKQQVEEMKVELRGKLMSGETPVQRQVEEAIRTAMGQMTASPLPDVPASAELPSDVDFEIQRQLGELLRKAGEAR